MTSVAVVCGSAVALLAIFFGAIAWAYGVGKQQAEAEAGRKIAERDLEWLRLDREGYARAKESLEFAAAATDSADDAELERVLRSGGDASDLGGGSSAAASTA